MSGDTPLADYTCMLLHTCIRGLLVQASAHPPPQKAALGQRNTEEFPQDMLQDPGVQEYLAEAIKQSAANEFEWGSVSWLHRHRIHQANGLFNDPLNLFYLLL